MNYYEVGLGVERHWKSAVFVYSFDQQLRVGSIVRIAFGKRKKTGIVLKSVKKPTFATKNIESVYDFTFSAPTLDFAQWYGRYYLADNGQLYTQFLPHYLSANPKYTTFEKPLDIELPALSPAQSKALKEIVATKKPSVLHGLTASGKTRIYTHLLLDQLKKGKNALLLYPEISLTPQIADELERYAPVVVFHSQLTNAERSKLWYSLATNTTPCIIVGPRSTLFLPHSKLGVVIMDEAHEPSYKQENDIRYSSIYVAAGLCAAHSAKLVLGSATPPISETEHILNRGGNLVCLHEKAISSKLNSSVVVVDAKNRTLFSKHQLISDNLLTAMTSALQKKEQTLLFINRRGTAKLVLCESTTCDWQAECPGCDLPMTYHHDKHQLLCHTCGRVKTIPTMCSLCGSKTMLKSLGSKAIVEDVAKLFPKARISRFDSDTDKQDSFHTNYRDIHGGSIDILIGTQQLIKGLDLPRLSTVGILNADLSLHFPDFSSDERTFQLIAQAMGRVGRGHTDGNVVLQTFQPNNPIIQQATAENWHEFRKAELKNRKKHVFPPYSFYSKILFREKTLTLAENKARGYKELMSRTKINIDGPIASFYAKRNGFYFVQLLLRSSSRAELLTALKACPKDAIVDLDPITLL